MQCLYFLLNPAFWLQSNKSRDHRYPVLFKIVQSHPRVPCRLFRDAQAPSAKTVHAAVCFENHLLLICSTW